MNITKRELENEIKLIKQKKLELEYVDKAYNLYESKNIIFQGTARETYIFIQGMKHGIAARGSKPENTDTFTVYDYFKNRVEKGFIIEAKKTSEDTYFSQSMNKYHIKIEKLFSDKLFFTAVADVITPSGYKSGSSIRIPLRNVPINKDDTIDSIGERILRVINVAMLDIVKTNKDLHSDRLLWLTKDDMWYLGWSNAGMLTKKVDIKVC
jgi:hypothetical protein